MKSIAELADALQSLQDRLSHGPVDCRGDVEIAEPRAREYGQVLNEYRQNVVALRDRNAHLRNEVKYLSGRVLEKQKRIGELETAMQASETARRAADARRLEKQQRCGELENEPEGFRRAQREHKCENHVIEHELGYDIGDIAHDGMMLTARETTYVDGIVKKRTDYWKRA